MTLSGDLISPALIADGLARLRDRAPRVHCITNSVAQAFTANVLLALGAVPSMTIAPEEVEGFAESADALLINLGTLDHERREAIPLAMGAAARARRPIVLDPVFVNRSPVRCAMALELVGPQVTLLRANQAEMDALFPEGDGGEQLLRSATALALTGPQDLVCHGGRAFGLANGHPLLAKVTATGCAGGAVIAAFLAVEQDPALAAIMGLSVFNIAGELAARKASGPGSLVPALLDALWGLTEEQIGARLRLCEPEGAIKA